MSAYCVICESVLCGSECVIHGHVVCEDEGFAMAGPSRRCWGCARIMGRRDFHITCGPNTLHRLLRARIWSLRFSRWEVNVWSLRDQNFQTMACLVSVSRCCPSVSGFGPQGKTNPWLNLKVGKVSCPYCLLPLCLSPT